MTDPTPVQPIPEPRPFEWSSKRAEAAMLVAEDELTNQQIADRLGVGPKTITTWKQHPDFRARVEQHIDELLERARRRGLARLDKRQKAQFDRHDRMRALLEARAGGTVNDVPGASTGLVVTRERSIGSGDSQQVVVEHEFDAALMREFRELEKQIAQDAGQWSEKRELTGPGGQSLVIQFVDRTDGPQ